MFRFFRAPAFQHINLFESVVSATALWGVETVHVRNSDNRFVERALLHAVEEHYFPLPAHARLRDPA